MSDTVLVTGANSGIGLSAVLELARRGFHAVGSVRSEEKARHVHAEAEQAGVKVDTVLLDVTDADACDRVIADLRPFGLVNNAGSQITGAIEEIADDEDLARRDESPYHTAYQRSLTGIRLSRRFMGDPHRVAKVIAQAMTSRFPRPRYLVGYDAMSMAALQRFVPTMVRDRITRLAL